MRRRRHVVQYASMTSLADVMFVLVFASLIYSAGLEQKAREAEAAALATPAPEPVPAPPAAPDDPQVSSAVRDAEELHRAALAQLMVGLEGRVPVVARIARDGLLRALERREAGRVVMMPLALTLVERVPDPDVALVYLGDRPDGVRLCSLLRLQLGARDLADTLVLVVPDAPLDDLSVALARGLQRDVDRCASDQRGVAVIVDPRAGAIPKGGNP